jgi:hypothetical protein
MLCVVLLILIMALVEGFHGAGSVKIREKSMATTRWSVGMSNAERSTPHVSSSNFIPTSLDHMGNADELGSSRKQSLDALGAEERANYNMNVGKALEVLRRQLPYVFAINDLDYSIFAHQITLQDEKQNRFVMQKSLYAAAVKSLRMASAISIAMAPSMNVRNIQYVEDCMTIECTVEVVLPDAIRVNGQAVWEGMFFFGLNSDGLIRSHTFDRKISTLNTQQLMNTASYPWIQGKPASPQILSDGAPVFSVNDQHD